MKLVLIGFMGGGKTTISQMLATRLTLKNIDMDEEIIKISGRRTDTEIMDIDGETIFRELELQIARKLRTEKNAVISTGGGVIMNKLSIDYLKESAVVIFLDHSFETAVKRLAAGTPPPLFRSAEKARKLYALRKPLYQYYADIHITTDEKTPDQVTEEIIQKIKRL